MHKQFTARLPPAFQQTFVNHPHLWVAIGLVKQVIGVLIVGFGIPVNQVLPAFVSD